MCFVCCGICTAGVCAFLMWFVFVSVCLCRDIMELLCVSEVCGFFCCGCFYSNMDFAVLVWLRVLCGSITFCLSVVFVHLMVCTLLVSSTTV